MSWLFWLGLTVGGVMYFVGSLWDSDSDKLRPLGSGQRATLVVSLIVLALAALMALAPQERGCGPPLFDAISRGASSFCREPARQTLQQAAILTAVSSGVGGLLIRIFAGEKRRD